MHNWICAGWSRRAKAVGDSVVVVVVKKYGIKGVVGEKGASCLGKKSFLKQSLKDRESKLQRRNDPRGG